MPQIYLTFVWHMHQPFYKDLATGEYQLPWTRMHALKDYFGMVEILRAFPRVHQTFNLVPSMMVQIQEYAESRAADPFLRVALKPAEELSEGEQTFLLTYFFQAHPSRMIRRFPRYGELYDAWLGAGKDARRARGVMNAAALRDLQVLSQVAWFDEEYLAKDESVRALVAKERGYSRGDQALMGRKQVELCGRVIPAYREFATSGQIEVSTTPFYHPILPLLCDSNIAGVAHPMVPLPRQFSYPDDARHQLRTAREYMQRVFGAAPTGLWPSEGSVSDAALGIAAEEGFRWAATDNGVLGRTLNCFAGHDLTYRPYRWQQEGRTMNLIFRDHELSDLPGFVYSRMDAHEACDHFLRRVRESCAGILASGRDAMVPVILDGENAWEHYDRNGRPFLSMLYGAIAADPSIEAVTVSEALERVPADPLPRIFPGSWINANFDIWIGAEEDNRAWNQLLEAREAYDNALAFGGVPEKQLDLAFEELMIAEGSDWCWWYGPEHYSENRAEFDQLFRSHLANVYRAIGVRPPEELSRPIIKLQFAGHHQPPAARFDLPPTVDGEITSFFEWLAAGRYAVDARSGAMHGQRFVIRELRYGVHANDLYIRVDFDRAPPEMRLHLVAGSLDCEIELAPGVASASNPRLRAAFQRVLEIAVPLEAAGAVGSDTVKLQLSLWQGALPLDSLPQEGWIDLNVSDPADWPA